MKNIRVFLSENCQFLEVKFSIYFNRRVFVMYRPGAHLQMNHNIRKHTYGHVRPAKIRISLCILTNWSESSLGAFWTAKDAKFLHTDNEHSDQTARRRTSIWILVGHTCQKIFFSRWRSIYNILARGNHDVVVYIRGVARTELFVRKSRQTLEKVCLEALLN